MIRLQNYASDWGQRIQRIQSVRQHNTSVYAVGIMNRKMSRNVDKMGQYEWGKGPKSRNMVKLSYKLCISSSDRGKCLLAWIIHCLCFISIFFFLKTQEKFGIERDAVLSISNFSSGSRGVNPVSIDSMSAVRETAMNMTCVTWCFQFSVVCSMMLI